MRPKANDRMRLPLGQQAKGHALAGLSPGAEDIFGAKTWLSPPLPLTKEEVLSRMKDSGVILVNVLTEKDFDKIHIQGSQCLTLGQNVRAFAIVAKRKFQKGTHFITYGLDGESLLGLNAAKILVSSGFKADHYPGGLADWVKAALPTDGTSKDIASLYPKKKN